MNIETRKISLAQWVLSLQKEDVLKKLEEIAFSLKSSNDIHIPEWQIEETRRRIKLMDENPDELVDFDQALKDIEKEL
jgi:hypothetical protein